MKATVQKITWTNEYKVDNIAENTGDGYSTDNVQTHRVDGGVCVTVKVKGKKQKFKITLDNETIEQLYSLRAKV